MTDYIAARAKKKSDLDHLFDGVEKRKNAHIEMFNSIFSETTHEEKLFAMNYQMCAITVLAQVEKLMWAHKELGRSPKDVAEGGITMMKYRFTVLNRMSNPATEQINLAKAYDRTEELIRELSADF